VPVYRRVLSDVLTPVSAFHKIDDGGNACLFESVIGGEKVGRYSFLAAEPFVVLEAYGKTIVTKPSSTLETKLAMELSAADLVEDNSRRDGRIERADSTRHGDADLKVAVLEHAPADSVCLPADHHHQVRQPAPLERDSERSAG